MAFLKFAKATMVNPHVDNLGWAKVRTAAKAAAKVSENLVDRATEIFGKSFNPADYLLTHATIVASVDTFEPPNVKLGKVTEDGFHINRKFSNYRVKLGSDQYINNNLDCWDRDVLLKSYQTFIGAHNFVEHVQIEELSKGRIIDAVARDLGDTVYVDILIATDRKHEDLVKAIVSKKMGTLSMGCFTPGTLVTMADGRRIAIEDVQPGDMVLTHKGRAREVLNKQIRGGKWDIRRIKAVGVPNTIEATDNHPFFVFRQPDTCACGCDEALPEYKNGRKNATRKLKRRFLRGHDKRILNPNNTYSIKEYKERKARMDAIQSGDGQWVRADELRIGDFVCFPRYQVEGDVVDITEGKARLLGYFLAEGSFQKYQGELSAVEFSFSTDEEATFVAEVVDLLKQEFPGKDPTVNSYPHRKCCSIRLGNRQAAHWFFKHGGEYSNGKRLSSDVMRWSLDAHKHLIGTWINGDGHLHNIHGYTSGTTTSYDLACQMHMLMARCGWFARMEAKVGARCVEVREIANGGFVRDEVTGKLPHFNVIVGKTQAVGMAPYTTKTSEGSAFGSQGPRVRDDVVMFPITSIEEATYEGWVHNMEVAEDHSYVVSGVCTQNCTVDGTICTKCGHWAADETEMCSHIKYEKGNTFFDEQGRQHRVAELCFPPSTRVVMADGSRQAMGDVQVGDMVLTHTGQVQPITKLYERYYTGSLATLKVTGLPQTLKSTPNHPYWVLSPNDVCACGCGQRLSTRKKFDRAEYTRKWAPGHHPNGKGVVSLERPTFTFKEAGELRVGDMVALPVPQQTVSPKGLNADRAHLLGWFLAEGSFIKRKGVRVGLQFTLNATDEREVADDLARLLELEFAPEARPTATRADTSYMPPTTPMAQRVLEYMEQGPCLARNIQQALGLGRGSVESVLTKYRKAGLVRSWRPSPEDKAGLDLGGVSIGQAKLWALVGASTCRRTARGQKAHLKRTEALAAGYVKSPPHVYQYDRTTEDGEKLVVCYTNRTAAHWFHQHAGEYAAHKRLPEGAIHWPQNLQKPLLRAYVHGDGGHDVTNRFSVSSISETLISQMQIIAARCGLWSRRQVVFDGKCVEMQSVVNGLGLPVGTDGFRPRHELHFQPADATTKMFSWGGSGHVRGIAPAWREYGGCFLFRVREVGIEAYNGLVCNFEVAGDNSYQVEGVAVHNCGHDSIDPNGGVQFVEGSWVGTPAFTGAILHNILEMNKGNALGKAASEILAIPPDQWTKGIRLKAAALAFGGDQFMAGWGDEDEEGGGEGDEGETPAEEKGGPFDDLEKELTDHMRDRVRKKLKKDMDQKDLDEALGPEDSSTSTNDNVVKQSDDLMMEDLVSDVSRKVAYGVTVSFICRTATTDADLVNKVALLDADYGVDISVPLYRAALRLGSTTGYVSVNQFVRACHAALGRKPIMAEAKVLLRLGKLISTRGQARGDVSNHPGSRQQG